MGTYYYDGQVKFELPWDFEYSKEYNDEGKETYHIRTGSYYNDDGEKCYKFSCGIGTAEASDDTPVTSLRDMAKNIAEGDGKTRFLMFDENPEIVMFTRGMPMNLFGLSLLYYMLVVSVLVERNHIVNLSVVSTYMEDDEYENLRVFENMATVIRSMSVNGKKNDLQGMDAQALHTALKPCFNEEDNVDLDERLRELLGGSEEDVSYADQPLPDGVCASEDGYAVINDDWAVCLPDGWVFSSEGEHTGGRPFAAISRDEYEESGRNPFDYGDNCFIVFRMAETGSNEYGMHGMLAGLMNSNEKTVVDRLGLRVSYSCRHEESSTYCQFVTVTTRRASYMIQLFYTDEYLGEYGRIGKIEEILNTICLAYEVPYSERYQRREHVKPAVTTKKTTKKSISFKRACPDESLYPHYHSLLNSPLKSIGLLGVKVVVNSTGTEYAFQSFRSVLNSFSTDPDENLSEEQKNRLTRILNKDVASYELHKKAKAMQSLFHVDPSVFDPKRDRECELEHGLMHRAYMMSALRSFAWTLSAYCKESGETPATVDYSCIRDLIAYIASHNWLNYDGESHCDGLCGGSDLHVYFVPDSTSAEDRRQLRGDGISEEEETRIREKFQNFNIIRSQVRSLDALRRDLAYIYPAIVKIYDTLKASRNNKEQLLGDEADILYAWCALALAAKEPFFSEDGPMNCWFEQKNEEISPYIRALGNKSTPQPARTTNPSPKNPELSPKLWEMNGTTLLKYKGNKWNPEIPEGITVIGERAFADHKNVKSIYMRNGVTRIEHLAFANIAPWELMIPPTVIYIADDIFGDRRSVGSDGLRWPGITELKLCIVKGSYADQYFKLKDLPNIKIEYIPESKTMRRKKKELAVVHALKNESEIPESSKAFFDKFEKVNVPKTRRKLLDKSLAAQKTTGYDLIIRPITVDESFRRVQKAAEEHYKIPDLYDQAAEYATLFPPATEVEIHSGYIKNIASVHALKSFVSTGYFYCKKQKKLFKNLSTEEIIALADYIDFCGGTNFKPHNYQSNTVFCEFLREEKESGYKVFSVFDPEVTSATATGLCIDLNTIRPQIEKIYNHLLSQDDHGMVNGALENILIAWCTFAIACSKYGAFTVDQATDERELSQCDIPEHTPIKAAPIIQTEDGMFIADGWLIDYKGASDCMVIPEMVVGILPARKNPDLLIDINPLGKATTIKFASPKTDLSKCSMQKRHVSAIEIAEGIEIIPEGFLSGNIDVKEVVLPESIKEIRSKAFHNYSWEYEHNKKTPMKVNVPFGVREIADDAFSECQRITVCKASYAERFFEERNFSNVQVTLTKEQLEAQKQEEERRKREYEERRRREAEERARKAAEEAEQRRKAAEEAERKRQVELVEKRSRYDALQKNISEQEQIIAENRGWFGAQAKARKAAKEQLASLQAQLNREFPNGRP